MKKSGKITSIVFKNEQEMIEGKFARIEIDASKRVDIYTEALPDFPTITTDTETLTELMESLESKTVGICEGCGRYVGKGEHYTTTSDGCVLGWECS